MKWLKSSIVFLLLLATSLAYADFTPPVNPYDDPPDANTLLQCSFDEADGSTTTDDESSTNHTLTNNGDVQTDTAQYKWTASSLFDGTGDWWSLADHANWTFGSSDFTIDYWIRMNEGTDFTCGHMQDDSANYWWTRSYGPSGSIAFRSLTAGVADLQMTASPNLATGTWYHIVIQRSVSLNQGYIYVDGVSKTVTLVEGAYNATLPNLTGSFYIGQRGFGASVNGWMDEFRISNTLRTWTAPPSGKQFIMIIGAFNPNLIGSPAWTCKIKVMKWWKNLTWKVMYG